MREDFYAEYYGVEDRHWWFIGRRRIILAILADRLGNTGEGRARRILDLGCGTGAMLTHLRRFGEVEGVDADPRAVEFCHARGEDGVRLLESETLPFTADSFDLVTALDVLEHIEDDREALSEIGRVLRPGAILLATVPAHGWMWGAQDEISHHFRRYSAPELDQRISGVGLTLERLTYFNSILFAPIAAIRLARRIGPGEQTPRSDFEMTGEGRANRLLAGIFSAEGRWLRGHDLPVGVSLLAMASSPED